MLKRDNSQRIFIALTFLAVMISLIGCDISISFIKVIRKTKTGENIKLFDENSFAPLKIYCYELPERFQPNTEVVKKKMYNFDGIEFHYYLEVELHHELLKSPVLTANPEEADFFYVPVYSTACWVDQRGVDMNELKQYLRSLGPWYDRKNGTDHIIATGQETMPTYNAIYRAVADENMIIVSIGPEHNESWQTFHGQRNIIMPYVSAYKHIKHYDIDFKSKRKYKAFLTMSNHFRDAPVLTVKVREELAEQMKKVNSDFQLIARTNKEIGNAVLSLPKRMTNADFCPCPRGDYPLQKRIFDSIFLGCIPVIISDNATLPYENTILNYSDFSLRVPENQVDQLADILNSYSDEEVRALRENLKIASKYFRYRLGEKPVVGEAFWAFTWNLYIKYLYQSQYRSNFAQRELYPI